MAAPFNYKIQENNCWLSAERMLYWEDQKALVVADLHFGKTGHFRKEGIAVPQSVYKEDLQRLVSELQFFQPRHLIVVGDMFHSVANKEMNWFIKWREDFPDLKIQLVLGNHDILKQKWYKEAGIDIHYGQMPLNNFSFVHDINDLPPALLNQRNPAEAAATNYAFSGHIHPGVRINGAGKQSLQFPCFYFTPAFCVLPAFSRFTGFVTVKPNKEDNVFAIVNKSIIQL